MRHVILGMTLLTLVSGGCASEPVRPKLNGASAPSTSTDSALLDYARNQRTTGLLVVQDGRTLVERNWPAPKDDPIFSLLAYERAADGALLEDVASLQKSVVAILLGIAMDKGLVEPSATVSSYLGNGWSKAGPDRERLITLDHLMTMTSGLDEDMAYVAPAGSRFAYNTAVYALTKRILVAASGLGLDELTKQWLTAPLVMADTAWRQRPGAMADVGNATGLVTSPRDLAKLGEMVLAGGLGPSGQRIVSKAALASLFEATVPNPAYGRLWWLNDGGYSVGATGERREGALIPSAPRDLVAALGYLDRRLYIAPSRRLIVVRTGPDAPDPEFDNRLWTLINAAIH